VAAVALHEYRHFYFCSVTGRLQNGEILMNRETVGENKANMESVAESMDPRNQWFRS
jgi:hypothetical protein